MLAEVNSEQIQRQEATLELEQKITKLEEKLLREQKARQLIEKESDTTQKTLDGAIKFRKARREDARNYLEQMESKSDG